MNSAPQRDSLLDVFNKRHSGRSYDSLKPVTLDQIKLLVEAARLAPSCYNEQPWRFIICDRHLTPEAYAKTLSCLVEFNQNWAKNAPLLIISISHNQFTKNQKPNRWGQYDTGAAAFSMMLQATHLGLMVHQMGGFDEIKIQKEFLIPNEFIPISIIAVGYESSAEQTRSPPPKDRRAIQENFFLGKWSSGFQISHHK